MLLENCDDTSATMAEREDIQRKGRMYRVAGAPNDVSYEDITHIHVPASKTTVMLCYYVTADSCSYIFWNLLSAAFPCLQPIRGWRVALRQT